MSIDSLNGKYVGSIISTDSLMGKYLRFSIVRPSLVYLGFTMHAFFALIFHIPVAEKNLFYQTQSSTILISRVLDIPALLLDNIIGSGVVL